MKEQFGKYLVSQGYKECSKAGNPSTAIFYPSLVDNIREFENMTWQEVIDNIDGLVANYDIGGNREEMGNEHHRANINALKRFREFIKSM